MQVKLEGNVVDAQDVMGWIQAVKAQAGLSFYEHDTNKIAAANAQFHVYTVKLKSGKYAFIIEQK